MSDTRYGSHVTQPQSRPRRRISYVRWTVSILILIPVVFVWGLFLHGGLLNFQVISGSMEPTILIGDRVLVDTSALPEDLRGLIIALHAPNHPYELLTKRVIAQEGDRVRIWLGEVRVNGIPVPGPAIEDFPSRVWELGPGELFVMGDNRNNSNDSKDWGPITRKDVVGLVYLRYWPFSRFGRVL